MTTVIWVIKLFLTSAMYMGFRMFLATEVFCFRFDLENNKLCNHVWSETSITHSPHTTQR